MRNRFGGTVYWIISLITGVIIFLFPGLLKGKFYETSPDNLYVGGIMIVVSSGILLWKTIKWFQEPED